MKVTTKQSASVAPFTGETNRCYAGMETQVQGELRRLLASDRVGESDTLQIARTLSFHVIVSVPAANEPRGPQPPGNDQTHRIVPPAHLFSEQAGAQAMEATEHRKTHPQMSAAPRFLVNCNARVESAATLSRSWDSPTGSFQAID